jgi:3-dehydroquinate dehydratase/shikimate dehydrogenase
MTYLVVPITVHTPEQARRDAILATEAGADMVELRIDELLWPFNLDKFPLPYIVTCRRESEGGQSTLGSADRLALLNSYEFADAAYLDIELATLKDASTEELLPGAPQIISAHDFTGRPERLNNLMLELAEAGGAVSKIAFLARSIRDNLEAFELLLNRQQPTIALCMGEAGLISRVLAKKFGAFATFASLDADLATAPGQLSIDAMKNLFRWDAVGPKTKVFGVVGSPVAHSMSPALHNAAFAATGYDGVYVPLLVNPGYESFKAFMESFLAFAPLDLSGLSVTIPHKENCLRYLQEVGGEIEPLATTIGAVNTVAIERLAGDKPILRGFNTDYAAILDTITDALGISREGLAGKRVAVLGAGGTGRTAVAALAHYGAIVVIYNRTRERAEAVAKEFNGRTGKVVVAPLEKLCDSCCQVYVNTTSIGMSPNIDASPFGDAPPKLSSDTLVFDAVYNPPITKLLRDAKSAGAKTASGVDMFVRQAAGQFQIWTEKLAPVDVMRRVIEERLAVILDLI